MEIFPICCGEQHLQEILDVFPARTGSFPCRYLGLPLHIKKLRKLDYLPLLEKVGGKLPGWKGKLMTKASRAQLVKYVLTSIVSYHATVFPLPKWLIRKIDKLRRNFYWKGEDVKGNRGGLCLVKWSMVYRPKELGGLGIHDLTRFGRALRQRWCWFQWTDDERP
jgi:hypothetical protein